MTAPELKPCPFCGGHAEIEISITEVRVWCQNCEAEILRDTARSDKSRAKAITAWNTRAPDPDLDTHIGAALAEAAGIMTEDIEVVRAEEGKFSGAAFSMEQDAARILALRPTALTALDRAKREARVEGMRATLKAECRLGFIDGDDIRAMIEREGETDA